MTTLPVSSAYRDAIKVAILLQVPLTLLMFLLLDFGYTARIGACAMGGFWIGVTAVMFRRPRSPSRLDLLYVRWGYLVLLVLSVIVAPVIPRLGG
jgi:hypothetical protein